MLTATQKTALAKKMAREGISQIKGQMNPENGRDFPLSVLGAGYWKDIYFDGADYDQLARKVVTAAHSLNYKATLGFGGGVEIKPRPKKKRKPAAKKK